MDRKTNTLPCGLYSANDLRELDHIAVNSGIPEEELMRRAGLAAYQLLRQIWPQASRVGIACGAGNNAGDGYVVAQLAKQAGLEVHLYTLAQKPMPAAAEIAAANCSNCADLKPQAWPDTLPDVDVWVDALCGTGLTRPISGFWAKAVAALNASTCPIMSLDLPSGLQANSGEILGCAIKATITISFIGLTPGLFTGQAGDYVGKIAYADLDVPETIFSHVKPTATRINYPLLKHLLPPRAQTAHKGQFGHALLIGGDNGYRGAIQMSAYACARTGAGWTSVATRSQHAAMISIAHPEIMAHGVENRQDLQTLLETATIVGIGPGLGQSPWAQELLCAVLERDMPRIIDASALTLLAQDPQANQQQVLTPHPGEAAHLLGISVREIQADRLAAICAIQQRYGGTIVLKGHGTLVIDHSGNINICDEGNPGMASAGMGDVLTGIISGLIAQGYTTEAAARLGVCLHAAAADWSANTYGERGLLASDLMPPLQRLMNPYQFHDSAADPRS